MVGSTVIVLADDASWSVSSHTYDSEDVQSCGRGVLLIGLGCRMMLLSNHSTATAVATMMSA